VQVVHAHRIDIRQGGGEQVRLLLVIAFDRHAVAWRDDRFGQYRRPLRRADLRPRVAEGPKARGVVAAVRRRSTRVFRHRGSPCQPIVDGTIDTNRRMGTAH
jgi:hypothetical protein